MARKREQTDSTTEAMAVQLRHLADTEDNVLDSPSLRRLLAKLILYQLADDPTRPDLIRLLTTLLGTRQVKSGKNTDKNTPAENYAELLKAARSA